VRAHVVGLGGGRYGLQVSDEASLIGVPGFELLRARIDAEHFAAIFPRSGRDA
jgi:hypothetical protein